MEPDNNCAVIGQYAVLDWTYTMSGNVFLIRWYDKGSDGSQTNELMRYDGSTVTKQVDYVDYVLGTSSAIMNLTEVPDVGTSRVYEVDAIIGSDSAVSRITLPLFSGK